MSFNPLMTLLVKSVVDVLGKQPTVVELGNQTFNANDATLDAVIRRSKGMDEIDLDGLNRLKDLVRQGTPKSAAIYYKCLGFSTYDAIDISDKFGSLVMDLNKDLREGYGFTNTYDLVTNNGTGEHIFDQACVLRNMHNLTKPAGVMVHVMPMLNYVNHGFYCFQPSLYYSLSRANQYQILELGFANRRGVGVMAEPESGMERMAPFLLEEKRIPLGSLLGKARFEIKGRHAGLKRLRRLFRSKKVGNELGQVIGELDSRFKNIFVVAVMRKVNDASFETPIQTLYADDFADLSMRSGYATASPAVEGAR